MPNSIWRKRRLKKGLEISEVANYLDISYERYALIDRGIVKMPNKYIEKFNELINKNKGETKINTLTRQEIVNVWWDKMSVKTGRGEYALREKMREFNIDTLRELDLLLGYTVNGAMSNYLNGHQHASFDVKNKVYSFFENELNIQPPKNKLKKEYNRPNAAGVQQTDEYKELLAWYKQFDLKQWRVDNNLTNSQIVAKSGLSDGTIHNIMYNRFQAPCLSTLKKLKTFIDNYYDIIDTEPVVMTFTSVPTNEVPEEIRRQGEQLVREVNENMTLKEKLINKYETTIRELEEQIEKHQMIIVDISREKEVYEQVLADLED